MLREICVACARHPILRRAASRAFRLPVVGGEIRKSLESIVPLDKRLWIQIPSGTAEGLWLKVFPKWEPGYLTGCAEEGMNEALGRYLVPGSCFYDVGAHIGFYSLIAARLVGTAGQVIAFEPDPDNAKSVAENADRNGFRRVSVVCAAVSESDGVVRFRRSGQDGPSRMSGMIVREGLPQTPGADILSCPTVMLDSFCLSRQPPTVIKIDVEGAELQVLAGARALLERQKPIVIIEVHDQKDLPAVRSFLSGLDYSLEPIGPRPGQSQSRNFVASVG